MLSEMLSGERYLHSRSKRAVDLLIANSARPAETLAIWVAKRSFPLSGHSTILQQERGGTNGEPFTIDKIRTLDIDNEPINEMAERFRTFGLDELTQIRHIREGRMSVFGRRPLIAHEERQLFDHAEETAHGRTVVDIYRRVVTPAKPGIISTFGFEYHVDHSHDVLERLGTDITDHLNASIVYDMGIAVRGLSKLFTEEKASIKHYAPATERSEVVTEGSFAGLARHSPS